MRLVKGILFVSSTSSTIPEQSWHHMITGWRPQCPTESRGSSKPLLLGNNTSWQYPPKQDKDVITVSWKDMYCQRTSSGLCMWNWPVCLHWQATFWNIVTVWGQKICKELHQVLTHKQTKKHRADVLWRLSTRSLAWNWYNNGGRGPSSLGHEH